MIDIDRAEMFSPFRVWARGGQAPLRAQALPHAAPGLRVWPGAGGLVAVRSAAGVAGHRFVLASMI
jgi:hypothetical protein